MRGKIECTRKSIKQTLYGNQKKLALVVQLDSALGLQRSLLQPLARTTSTVQMVPRTARS
jgi:hypothetical protein